MKVPLGPYNLIEGVGKPQATGQVWFIDECFNGLFSEHSHGHLLVSCLWLFLP